MSATFTFGALPVLTYSPNYRLNVSTYVVPGLTAGDITYYVDNTHTTENAFVSLNGSRATILAAGTTTIIAYDRINSFQVTRQLQINKAPQTTFTFTAPSDVTYTVGGTVDLSQYVHAGQSTSALVYAFDDGSTSLPEASLSASVLTILAAGQVNISVTHPGDNNYLAASSVTHSLTINKAQQTLAFSPIPVQTFGFSPLSITALVTPGGSSSPPVYAFQDSGSMTTTGATLTLNAFTGIVSLSVQKAGAYTIEISQLGDNDFEDAVVQTQQVVVQKANQNIVFRQITPITYGDVATVDIHSNVTAGASSSPVVYTIDSPTTAATLNGSVITILTAGVITIDVSQVADANYNAVPLPGVSPIKQTLIINQASQTLTFGSIPIAHTNDQPINLATYTTAGLSMAPVVYTFEDNTTSGPVGTINGHMFTIAGPGIAKIVANQAADVNYSAAAPVTAEFSVIGESSYLYVQLCFLEVLQRQATSAEVEEFVPLVNDDGVDAHLQASLTTIRNQLMQTTEYLQVSGSPGTLSYNPALWTLNVSTLSGSNYNGCTLGNGKIAMVTSAAHNQMTATVITTNFDENTFGRYNNNVVETFNYTTFGLTMDPAQVEMSNLTQELNMMNGMYEMKYKIKPSTASAIPGTVNVVHDIVLLRQFPYCVMQNITLTATHAQTLDFYHQLITPSTIADVNYNNNFIMVPQAAGAANIPVYFFSANGILKDSRKKITTNVSYVFTNPSSCTNKGYNMQRNNTDVAFNKLTLTLSPQTDTATNVTTYTTKFTIMTCTMSQFDFEYPETETTRVLINICSRTAASVLTDHSLAWSKMWTSNMKIVPKDGITDTEAYAVTTMNQNITFSLYNIYAVIRDDINVEVNPLNLSTVDFTGHIFYSADLWLLPVLTLLRPRAARTLLDYRYYHLDKARKLAAANGFAGTKFPYENDVSGYNDVYWNTMTPLYVFNTAMISVSAWSYYRVTRDLDWLARKGFEILKGNADFFVSMLTLGTDGKYHIKNVMTMNNTVASDNVVTNYFAYEAILFAIQATYELNYFVDSNWTTVVNNIALSVATSVVDNNTTYLNVLLDDESYGPDPTTGISPSLNVIEPLVVLMPYYSRDFFSFSSNYNLETIKTNLLFYLGKINTKYSENAINKLIVACMQATVAQRESAYNDKVAAATGFGNTIQGVIGTSVLKPWNTFTNSLYSTPYNDISISSLFLFTLLTSVGGLRVTGGITPMRFYYEDFGIAQNTSNVMPVTWKLINITGVGPTQTAYNLVNQLYYTAS